MLVNENNIKSSFLITHYYIDCWNVQDFIFTYLKELELGELARFRKIIRDVKNEKISLEFSNVHVKEKCLENLTKAKEDFAEVYFDYCFEDKKINLIENLLAKVSKIVKDRKVLN